MADTVKLHFAERGSGLPVVLLHGYPLDHTIWRAQIEALGLEYRVIAPDLRGHGQSPAPEGAYSMGLLARDVVGLLDDLGVERAVWVGHSMGGYVTMAALRTADSRVRAAAFVATHPFADPPERQQDRQNTAKKALESGSEAAVSGMVSMLFAPGTDLQSETVQRIRQIMVGTPPAGVAGSQQGMAARPDAMETLRAAPTPMAVIAGAHDQIVKPDLIAKWLDSTPRLRLVWIDGAGHMPMIEQPEATTAALREFLQAL